LSAISLQNLQTQKKHLQEDHSKVGINHIALVKDLLFFLNVKVDSFKMLICFLDQLLGYKGQISSKS